jgi:hypothetical protein
VRREKEEEKEEDKELKWDGMARRMLTGASAGKASSVAARRRSLAAGYFQDHINT